MVNEVESVAVPELSAPVPIEEPLLRKVTVPVAAVGVTVAVSVMLVPVVTVLEDTASVVVLAVVPVEVPLGFCQKSPQPSSRSAAARRTKMKAV